MIIDLSGINQKLRTFLIDEIDNNNFVLYFEEQSGSSLSYQSPLAMYDLYCTITGVADIDVIVSYTVDIYSVDTQYTIGSVPLNITKLKSTDYNFPLEIDASSVSNNNTYSGAVGKHGLYIKINNIIDTQDALGDFEFTRNEYIG